MATYTIKINEKTKEGKRLAAMLGKSKAVTVFSHDKKRPGLEEALEDVRQGRVFRAKDADDLIRQCLG
ncbi:MAG: hypothetical protein AB7D05_09520 [Mangrovibacterium sp.]